jgi:hypothetical protein
MRYFISTLILLGLPVLCFGESMKFVNAQKLGDEFDAKFSWGYTNYEFSLSAKGILSPESQTEERLLQLPIEEIEYIDRLSAQRYDTDLLLAIETSDGDGGRGVICRIKWPQNSILWCQKIPGFNVHASSSMGSIYIGAIGILSRLNPNNGKYIWEHSGLYQNDDTLNVVCFSSENDKHVIFDATSGIQGDVAKQITLDRNTGKIIRKSDIGTVSVCR